MGAEDQRGTNEPAILAILRLPGAQVYVRRPVSLGDAALRQRPDASRHHGLHVLDGFSATHDVPEAIARYDDELVLLLVAVEAFDFALSANKGTCVSVSKGSRDCQIPIDPPNASALQGFPIRVSVPVPIHRAPLADHPESLPGRVGLVVLGEIDGFPLPAQHRSGVAQVRRDVLLLPVAVRRGRPQKMRHHHHGGRGALLRQCIVALNLLVRVHEGLPQRFRHTFHGSVPLLAAAVGPKLREPRVQMFLRVGTDSSAGVAIEYAHERAVASEEMRILHVIALALRCHHGDLRRRGLRRIREASRATAPTCARLQRR
eukprot:scaffold2229_cov262-Pinguiococcus_pyrenoidosus.AAC.4